MAQYFEGGTEKEHTKVKTDEFPGNTLGGKVGNTLIGVGKRVFEGITGWFEERLVNFAVRVLTKIELGGATVFATFIKMLKDKEAIPPFLKPIFDEIEDPKHEIGAVLGGAASNTAIGGLFGAIFDPLMAPTKYGLNKLLKPYQLGIDQAVMGKLFGIVTQEDLNETILAQGFRSEFSGLFTAIYKNKIPFNELLELLHRGSITEVLFKERLRLLGFEDLDIKMLENLIYKIPSIAESVVAYFKGTISEHDLTEIATKNGIDKEFLNIIVSANRKVLELMDVRSIYFRANKNDIWLKSTLAKLGYDDDTIKDIKEIFPYFPQVQDLIRFAVREVYSPEIVTKYGQMEDLPSKFIEEGKKAGLPEEQAKNFWAAHWELPGFREGAEMLHRGVINYDDLVILLRTLDVMPYWRDKLIKIAYSPYTRVDTRRMFGTGILTRDQVKTSYKDIGYDEEHAENLTKWTEITANPKKQEDALAEKDLTKADILEGYQRKYFTLSETIKYLNYLGYDQEEAAYYASKVEYKENKESKDQIVKLYEDMYKKGIVDDNAVTIELGKYGVTTPEIGYYLTKWAVATVGKSAVPSLTDLKNWVKGKIVSRETFIEEMSNLGYSAKYIDCYLREAKLQGL